MRVCLIGANGFIGNAIGSYANKHNIELVVIGRSSPNNYNCAEFIQSEIKADRFPFDKCAASDIVIYAASAGVQSNHVVSLQESFEINTLFPLVAMENLAHLSYNGCLVTFGT
jgi:putative NADH-flavin reductase